MQQANAVIILMFFLLNSCSDKFDVNGIFEKNDEEIIQYIKQNPDKIKGRYILRGPNQKSSDEMEGKLSLLYISIIKQKEEVALFLIGSGAEVNYVNQLGFTPLHLSVRRGNLRVSQSLIEAGANFNTINHEGVSPKEIAKQYWPEIYKLMR